MRDNPVGVELGRKRAAFFDSLPYSALMTIDGTEVAKHGRAPPPGGAHAGEATAAVEALGRRCRNGVMAHDADLVAIQIAHVSAVVVRMIVLADARQPLVRAAGRK